MAVVKECRCGRSYDSDGWSSLPLSGYMTNGADGELELRHCHCGSTIGIDRCAAPSVQNASMQDASEHEAGVLRAVADI
jgi:hypothetical protein